MGRTRGERGRAGICRASGSEWHAARLLGGTLAAMCRKEGPRQAEFAPVEDLGAYLRCPDCRSALRRDPDGHLRCSACGYEVGE